MIKKMLVVQDHCKSPKFPILRHFRGRFFKREKTSLQDFFTKELACTAAFVLLLMLSPQALAYQKPDVYVIDAQKNAIMHNNLGLKDVDEQNYYEAIQEFWLAINLNPNTQATSTYYNNLGEVYMKVGYYKFAQRCFEAAIKQSNLNFAFYKNLVASFKAQHLVAGKIKYYEVKKDNNSLNMVMLGLLYVANGDVRRGIIKLDEFCMKEPDLLITGAVKNYIKGIVEKNQ